LKGSRLLLKLTLPETRRKLTITNLQNQVQGFNRKLGEKFAIITTFVLTIVVGGAYIPAEIVLQFYMIGIIFINGIVIFWLITWFLRMFKGLEDRKQDQIDDLKKEKDEEVAELKYDFEVVKKTMGGRITVLEQVVPYAVWEMDLTTGLLLHVNENFYEITGYTKGEINDIITRTPQDLRPMVLTQLFVSEKDRLKVEELVRARFAGEIKKGDHKFEYVRKSGEKYPAKVDVHMVDNNGLTVVHGIINDYSHQQKMEDSNKGYEVMLQHIVKEFTRKVTQRELADFFFSYMDEMKNELKTVMVKEFGDRK
jgi:PAS domain S-box-containing protein